jgi:LruC domain-containing protein
MKKTALASACLTATLGLAASFDAQAIDWIHLGPYNPSSGVPLNMTDFKTANPAASIGLDALTALVYDKLPEGVDIRKNNADLITDDLGANLYFAEDAEVSVTFLHEGAGFLNSVGYFTFDPRNPPKTSANVLGSHKIMFPNFSASGSGGGMNVGNTVKLGKYKAGTALGFSLLANAWSGGKVNPNQPASDIFYTLKGLNPEKPGKDNLNAHTVLLAKPDDKVLALGFEDINRQGKSAQNFKACDHDFNDVVMVINVVPFKALDRTHVNVFDEKQDTDGDGVPDSLDAFPDDPERVSRKYYPSVGGYGYLAFEDNWPNKGDYDMNDWVVEYRAVETLNAQGQVVDLQLTYDVMARGALYSNGFAVHLPGVLKGNIKPVTNVSINGAAAKTLAPEEGQNEAVFVLVPNTTEITKTGQGGNCFFFNTMPGCPALPSVRIVANITLNTPQDSVGTAPYNPFLFRSNQRGLEIHLVDHPPTAKADMSLFGTADDASEPAKGRYYRSAKNLPWALDIPDVWTHPREWASISDTYLSFGNWAQSGGASSPDWYSKNVNPAKVYKP